MERDGVERIAEGGAEGVAEGDAEGVAADLDARLAIALELFERLALAPGDALERDVFSVSVSFYHEYEVPSLDTLTPTSSPALPLPLRSL